MAKPTCLVTGVAGFLGSHVAEHCLRQGYHVVGLDDLSGGLRENVPDDVVFYEGSITDTAFIERVFAENRFDYVYHLAAYAAEGLSHFIRRFNYETNLIGSMNLINASILQEVKCFVFTSSIAVYGAGQTPMTEDTVPHPEDPYGVSKLAVELDLEAAHLMFGLNSIVFRPHNVYGEKQNIADRYRNVIGIFMHQAMGGKPMTVFGDGLQTRAFSYIDEVAPIIAQSVEFKDAYNQVFNIGADVPYTVLQLVEEISAALGVPPQAVHLEARKEVMHAFSDHSKVRRYFPPAAPVSLRDGIRRMAAWARQCAHHEPTRFSAIEVHKNMPPSWLK